MGLWPHLSAAVVPTPLTSPSLCLTLFPRRLVGQQSRDQAQLELDPLSYAGSMRLYWSRRNDLVRQEASAALDRFRSPPPTAAPPPAGQGLPRQGSAQLSSLTLASAAAIMAPTSWRRLGSRQRPPEEDKSIGRAASWHDMSRAAKGKRIEFEQVTPPSCCWLPVVDCCA